jgi:hypothetical protein
MIYRRVAGAMIVAVGLRLALSAAVPGDGLVAEIHGVAAYLTVLGGLYGIVVAFLMFVVWEQWNHVQTGLEREAASLADLCSVAGFLSDRDPASQIRLALRRYVKDTVSDEPQRLASAQPSTVAQDSFTALAAAVRHAAVSSGKNEPVSNELMRALVRVIEARDDRLAISRARIPATLWNLVVFASVALLAGFLVLGLHSVPLSVLMVAAAAGIITFLLSVLKDMDNPFAGVWNVSYAPMTDAASRVG